jgi:ATP-dependent Clp protease ATP-binding subunit ClpA
MTLLKSGKTLHVSDEALEMVVVKGYSMAFGARFLKRYIDEQIKLPISAQWKAGSHFDVTVKDGALAVEPSVGGMPTADETLAYGDVA